MKVGNPSSNIDSGRLRDQSLWRFDDQFASTHSLISANGACSRHDEASDNCGTPVRREHHVDSIQLLKRLSASRVAGNVKPHRGAR
jgi:hypothetical protein